MKNPIIVLSGPTGSGKTDLSIELAKKFNGEIVATDSMTIYRGMDIGTDKVTLDPKSHKEAGHYFVDGVIHHMLDIFDPNEEVNISIFKEILGWEVTEIQKRKNLPFLVGGSLLYIDSYIYDYQLPTAPPDQELRKSFEKESTESLFQKLVELDPDAEWTIDKNNRRRIIRALEVLLKTGTPINLQKKKRALPKNVLYLALDVPREELYQKINKRVDEMMELGFLNEVKNLFEKYDKTTAMQAAGYRQLIEYLEGKITLPEAVEKTKKAHRNFAKRQLTWLRKNQDVVWIKTKAEAEAKITDFLG